MKKYILKSKSGIGEPKEAELGWSEQDFKDWNNGDEELQSEAMTIALDMVEFDMWVEEVEE